MKPRIGSLCSGYGGLELGLLAALGAGEVVWHAENDAGPAEVLEARFPGVPNLGDLTAVDWQRVERVDWFCAGYPCQPDSLAGKGLSEDDHRWIWPQIAVAVGALRPRYLLLENVAGHFVRGFRTVLGSLASLGYDATWTLVRASDVGAPHRRERLFVIAADATECGRWRSEGQQCWLGTAERVAAAATYAYDQRHQRRRGARDGWGGSADCGEPLTDSQGDGRDQRWTESTGQLGRSDVAQCGPIAAANASRSRLGERPGDAPEEETRTVAGDELAGDRGPQLATEWGPYRPAIRRWEIVTGRVAPRPTESGRNGERLSPRFVEWMQGLSDGWVTDVLGRAAALKCLGNGVVPQQAALAARSLLPVTESEVA